MNPLVTSLACLAPIAIFTLALLLRLAVDMQPETPHSALRRLELHIASYVFVGIGFFSLLFTFLVAGGIGALLLVMFVLATSQLVDMEFKLTGKRKRAQQVEFLWLLASSVRCDGDLAGAIETYAQGTWGRRHRNLLELAARIREGTPLNEITVPQGLLSQSATIEVQAGLSSARVYESLRSAAFRQTRELAEESTVTPALSTIFYPTAIMFACLLIVTFLMYYIIPKFKKIFDDFGTELPQITRNLIRMADFGSSYTVGGLLVIYVLCCALVTVAFANFFGWRAVIRTLIGYWHPRPHTADLLRSLAQTVAAGIPLQNSFRALIPFARSRLFRRKLVAMHDSILQGNSGWLELERKGFLSSREVNLLESAERVGNLPWTMNAIADAIERRWFYRMCAAKELLTPVVIVAMGFLVGFVCLAFFLPLVKLLNDLS
ncbi:MAG: type II secretion system F family protein [Planctomycetes bacterium]|nr:type II secretion system F family protein [Planctomycetota bacterium]